MRLPRIHFGITLLVLLAIVVRVAIIASTPYVASGDAADYDRHARSLQVTGSFAPTAIAQPGGPSALRPPLYPLLLAASYSAGGERGVAVGRVVGAVLGGLTVLLLYAVATSIVGRCPALWAAGFAAIFPPLAWLSNALLSENLFLPLVLGLTLALLAYVKRPGFALAATAGVLLGAATLTRYNGIVLVAPALLAMFATRVATSTRRAALGGVTVMLAAALVVAPWTVRNWQRFGALLPLGTQSGYTLAGQYNRAAAAPDAFEGVWRTPESVGTLRPVFERGLDEAQLSSALGDRARQRLVAAPFQPLKVLGLDAPRLFDLGRNHAFTGATAYREMGVPPTLFGQLVNWTHLHLLLAIAGLILARRRAGRAPGPGWLWAMPIVLLASVVFVQGSPRYRFPADPYLMLAVGIALGAVAARLDPRRLVRRIRRA